MKAEAPCFLWWPKDYLGDVQVARMSLAAQGAYVRLICHCWIDGEVPSDPQQLARIWGVSTDDAKELRAELEPCFRASERKQGWWAHPRVERERSKQDADREKGEKRSEQAARAAAARHEKHGKRKGRRNATAEHQQSIR